MIEDDYIEAEGEVEAAYTLDDLNRIGALWLDRLAQAEKREDHWRKQAESAEAAFTADSTGETGELGSIALPWFNIVHSNVETIVPAIYNSTAKPDIRPRHSNKDGVAKQVSDLLERAISSQIDDNRMDVEVEALAQDAFLTGRGVIRLRFDAEVTDIGISDERVIFENVSWRDYREGPATRWNLVPWVAYRHAISPAERERLENDDIAKAYKKDAPDAENEEKDCAVWEIWCKETRRVYFLVEDSARILDIVDDPLGLKDFFPQAEPVQPITATGKRIPVCPYSVYEKLAQELDTATKRINKIMEGLRVRGAVAAATEAIAELAEATDNSLVVVSDIEALVAAGGIEKAVMWWPIETAIAVLQQLYVQREQTKQAIYEVTGISDIIRGQGAASETATAQTIKTQWGALRVRKMQRMIERQIRNLFVLTVEVMARHFTPQGIQRAAGMQIAPEMVQLLQDPLSHYRVDVESDSTVRADLTRQREEMAQFLQGTAQFFSAMQPLVAAAPQAAGPLAEMYASFARQFSLGKAAEDALDQLAEMAARQSQQPPPPNPDMIRAEQDGKIKQAEMQIKAREQDRADQQLSLDTGKAEFEAAMKAAEMLTEQQEGAINGTRI